jgi:hypothetical protein
MKKMNVLNAQEMSKVRGGGPKRYEDWKTDGGHPGRGDENGNAGGNGNGQTTTTTTTTDTTTSN